ncbi:MAG: ubiquitin-activating E1 FCCH domain-containing protein [Aestuariivirga sp.]
MSAIPLFLAAGAAVDMARVSREQIAFADAVDSAALAVAASDRSNLDGLTGAALQARKDELKAYATTYILKNYTPQFHNNTAIAVSLDITNTLVTLGASHDYPMTIMKLAGIQDFTLYANSEVTRNSTNLEVAVTLDATGSMGGQKIIDLRAAANELVDLVVQDVQTPTYSKMALAPYSMGVNAGAYAPQVRGAIAPMKAMTGATRANPVVVTSNAHGFANGNIVYIIGVSGMTQINNIAFRVANSTANTFALTSATTGSNINGTSYGSYTSGGSISCTTPGCQYYSFLNPSGNRRTYQVSTCVTERTGAHTYTEAAPSTAFVGRNYASTGMPCINATITPLETNKTTLHATVNSLVAAGSTAGHIGVTWARYMLAPDFGYLWPAASQPAAYGTPNLLKVAIIMTDGLFNSPYCNGVVAQNATSGAPPTNDRINCNATNGNSYTQAQTHCDAMKAIGVIVYTVGFALGSDQNAIDFMNNCATDAAHVYLPQNGGALSAAFQAIAAEVNALRISK